MKNNLTRNTKADGALKHHWRSTVSQLKNGVAALCTMGALTFGFNDDATAQDYKDNAPPDTTGTTVNTAVVDSTVSGAAYADTTTISLEAAALDTARAEMEADSIEAEAMTCMTAGRPVKAPQDRLEARLNNLYEAALQTDMTRTISTAAVQDSMQICFNPALEDTTSAYMTIGKYNMDENRIEINPDPRMNDTHLTLTLVHEFRHKAVDIGVSQFSDGNYFEAERVALGNYLEADARLAEILFAHEMERRGDYAYANALIMTDNAPLYFAFTDALRENPEDIKGAMQAVIAEFKDTALFDQYADGTVQWIHISMNQYDFLSPGQRLMTDDVLMQTGAFAHYGRYMDQGMISKLRQNYYTQEEYFEDARPYEKMWDFDLKLAKPLKDPEGLSFGAQDKRQAAHPASGAPHHADDGACSHPAVIRAPSSP